MNKSREAIAEELLKVLRSFRPRKADPALNMHFIHDLHMLGDDVTEVILIVQKKIGVKPPVDEWSKVGTLNEAIELLLKYSRNIQK